MAGKFEIYTDKAGEFRFRLKASNGQVVLSSEGYKSKVKAGLVSTASLARIAEDIDLGRFTGNNRQIGLLMIRNEDLGVLVSPRLFRRRDVLERARYRGVRRGCLRPPVRPDQRHYRNRVRLPSDQSHRPKARPAGHLRVLVSLVRRAIRDHLAAAVARLRAAVPPRDLGHGLG